MPSAWIGRLGWIADAFRASRTNIPFGLHRHVDLPLNTRRDPVDPGMDRPDRCRDEWLEVGLTRRSPGLRDPNDKEARRPPCARGRCIVTTEVRCDDGRNTGRRHPPALAPTLRPLPFPERASWGQVVVNRPYGARSFLRVGLRQPEVWHHLCLCTGPAVCPARPAACGRSAKEQVLRRLEGMSVRISPDDAVKALSRFNDARRQFAAASDHTLLSDIAVTWTETGETSLKVYAMATHASAGVRSGSIPVKDVFRIAGAASAISGMPMVDGQIERMERVAGHCASAGFGLGVVQVRCHPAGSDLKAYFENARPGAGERLAASPFASRVRLLLSDAVPDLPIRKMGWQRGSDLQELEEADFIGVRMSFSHPGDVEMYDLNGPRSDARAVRHVEPGLRALLHENALEPYGIAAGPNDLTVYAEPAAGALGLPPRQGAWISGALAQRLAMPRDLFEALAAFAPISALGITELAMEKVGTRLVRAGLHLSGES